MNVTDDLFIPDPAQPLVTLRAVTWRNTDISNPQSGLDVEGRTEVVSERLVLQNDYAQN